MSPIIENLFERVAISGRSPNSSAAAVNPEPYKTTAVSLPKTFFIAKPKRRVSLSDFAPCFPSAAEHDAAATLLPIGHSPKLLSLVTSNAKDVSTETTNAAV